MTSNREAIRRLFKAGWDRTGNQPPMPGIYPDNLAPIIRTAPDGEREVVNAR